MEKRTLGRTGLHVSTLCLGGGMYGTMWGNEDLDACERVIHAAMDAGINFIDSADGYMESEVYVGHALRGRRDKVILTSKVNMPLSDVPGSGGNSKRWIRQAIDRTLGRLQTDYLDLYQLHRPDPDTDIDETLSVLSDLVREGKVRYIGSSTFSAAELVEAEWTAQRRGRERLTTTQVPYSLLYREVEASILPTCRNHGIGAFTFSPLYAGMLSDSWIEGRDEMTNRRAALMGDKFDLSHPRNRTKSEALSALRELAREHGISLIHMALAFAKRHPIVDSVIIGAGTIDQLNSQLGAADVHLDDSLLDAIDAIVPPGTSFAPDDFGYLSPSLQNAALRRRPR